MKKLITVAEVEKLVDQGSQTIIIDKNTLVTPAAKDLLKEKGISCSCVNEVNDCKLEQKERLKKPMLCVNEALEHNTSSEVFAAMKSILEAKAGCCGQSKVEDSTENSSKGRFQVLDPEEIRYEPFDTGVRGNQVFYKEIVGYKDSPNISSGILKMINSKFPWTVQCDEMDIVLEGMVKVTINGVTKEAKAGDVIYIPPQSEVVWHATEYAKIFYVTYPSNWAEL